MTARPRFRRRIAAAVLPLLTLASAGTVAARAADNNQNNADLAIRKTASPATVAVGGRVTYTLTVTNNGPRPGTQIRIHDELPSSVSFASADVSRTSTPADSCSQSNGVVDCTIHGNVRPDGSDSVVVTIAADVRTRPESGQICNTATVTGNHDDPDPANNNSASVCTTVVPAPARHADLSITKVADHDRVSIGDVVTYTVTARNAGPAPAAAPTVTDVLPANVDFVAATVASPASCSQAGGVVSCALGPMAMNGAVAVTIKVKPRSEAGGTTLVNCASVAATEDNAPANNRACASTAVRARADLSITKTADKTAVLIGEDLTYKLTVKNDGPNTATGVVVTDDIPNQADLQSVSTSQGAACPKTDPVSCNLGTLASGATGTVTIIVKPKVKGVIKNTASVTGNEEDPTPANSSSVSTTYVALTGNAFGESVDVMALGRFQVTSGPLASATLPAGGGGPFTGSSVNARVSDGLFGDLLRLDVLQASTQGGKRADGSIFVASSADVTKASLVNGLITVDGLHSECLATTASGGGQSSTNVVNLRVAGLAVQMAGGFGPNSSVTVPGVGTLILNEQVSSGSGLNQSRSVNGLHLKLDGLLAKGDVVLAHSDCGIDP